MVEETVADAAAEEVAELEPVAVVEETVADAAAGEESQEA